MDDDRIDRYLSYSYLYFFISLNILLTLSIVDILRLDISPFQYLIRDRLKSIFIEVVPLLFNKLLEIAEHVYHFSYQYFYAG